MQISGIALAVDSHSLCCGRRDVLAAQTAAAELQIVEDVQLLQVRGL